MVLFSLLRHPREAWADLPEGNLVNMSLYHSDFLCVLALFSLLRHGFFSFFFLKHLKRTRGYITRRDRGSSDNRGASYMSIMYKLTGPPQRRPRHPVEEAPRSEGEDGRYYVKVEWLLLHIELYRGIPRG